ncbi:MAG: hypothetical protein KIT11_05415 [Fimbriimonadaceae bacterium]|nr:hypothetical protein [Fimbriimonadaceae bacterium]QYK56669.1 MAG: hypothetical protein KF733_04105 [Fimbriimonadaceae bacterium]
MSDLAPIKKHIPAVLRARPLLAGIRVSPGPTTPDFDKGIVYWPVGQPSDVAVHGGTRLEIEVDYAVVADLPDSETSLAFTWAHEIDDALNASGADYPGLGAVYMCVRKRTWDRSYVAMDGTRRIEIGGVFTLRARGIDFNNPPI